ncbi:hypothetical protein GF342_02510 [Candidatus Woesearchaeota archaeon]|nr:hypothetical protein [Candidatus Woesearchaeota archaeon]
MARIIALVMLLGFLAACSSTPTGNAPLQGSDDPQLMISGDPLDGDTTDFNDINDVEDSVDTLDDTPTIDDTLDTSDDTTDTADTEDLPVKRVKEGELVSFSNLAASDPDGDEITFSFEEPLNNKGEWQTGRGDAGTYIVTITASDGTTSATQDVKIIVESVNAAPTIEVADVTVKEGEKVTLAVQTSDENDDEVTVVFSGWMDSATRDTSSEDIGEHEVTITASDGMETTSKTITVTVIDVNHAPVLDALSPIVVTEGEKVVIVPTASDTDKDTLTYTFSEPADKNGIWQTRKGDEGQYTITVTVSDGELEHSIDVDVTVEHLNTPPELSLADDLITVTEGDTVTIAYSTSDEDDDEVTVTFSGWKDSATFTTTYDDAGEHTITVTASDGKDEVSQDVTIIVEDKNRPPVFDKNAFI